MLALWSARSLREELPQREEFRKRQTLEPEREAKRKQQGDVEEW
jgi:hypothetical protein